MYICLLDFGEDINVKNNHLALFVDLEYISKKIWQQQTVYKMFVYQIVSLLFSYQDIGHDRLYTIHKAYNYCIEPIKTRQHD